MPRRFACLAGAFAVLLGCAPASPAATPRIIEGSPASQGEYPAHGALRYNGNLICGGTLISNRHFLTAAHCVTTPSGGTLATSAFSVRLGSVDHEAGDLYTFASKVVHEDYDSDSYENDMALLTLSTPASPDHEPLRVIDASETGLWADGDIATIVGWGSDEAMAYPDALQEATIPMRSDAYCASSNVWGTAFFPATMVCGGGGRTDTCDGDSGGPLMVSDGSFLVLAGLTSWGKYPCAQPDFPGVYTRLGAPALNAWVRNKVPMARASGSDATVDPEESVTYSVSVTQPGITDQFTWDFGDGTPDGSGATVTHAYPDVGRYVARVVASGAGPDTATDKVAVQVGDPPPPPDPTPVPTAEPTAQPAGGSQPGPSVSPPAAVPAARPVVSGPLATILAARRPKVGGGRFGIRVRFARSAPAGTAVVEVIRARQVIGIARARVLRGGTKRIRVKLTPSGRRQLLRSRSGRLTFEVRVRVGRRVLRSKTVTIRR